jgi:hypothetical protein
MVSKRKRGTRYQDLVLAFCFLFGLALIANTQVANDGGWMWYAILLRNGRLLYADMHLALQPLFVLETSWILGLFGRGWLVSKILAVLDLGAFCLGLRLLSQRSNLPDWQKAIVLGTGFFVAICSIAYRFDDYHTPADSLVLFSLLFLLDLKDAQTTGRITGLAAVLGVLSGLAITLRINDGGALWFGMLLSILCIAPKKRFVSAVIFILAAALIWVFVVHLTGDSFHDYAMYSIFKAANGKGGAGNVLYYPLRLPWNALRFSKRDWFPNLFVYTYVFGLAAIWAFGLAPLLRSRGQEGRNKWVIAGLLILAAAALPRLLPGLLDSFLMTALNPIGVLASYVLGIAIFVRYLKWEVGGRSYSWDSREILLITPLGQMISTATSSGGVVWGVYEPLAMLIVVLPIASPIRLKKESIGALLVGVCAVMFFYGVGYRFRVPYEWHSERSRMMFAGRQWYRHPVYGPMIIDRDLLALMKPICDDVGPGRSDVTFLGLPYSYGNYFCDIPPWHDYVQTYYDTSTPATIFGLMDELEKAPPQWILYERQPESLAAHEKQFNRGQPLPHRYLDELIERKIAEGRWQPIYLSHYGQTSEWSNEWILMRTGE